MVSETVAQGLKERLQGERRRVVDELQGIRDNRGGGASGLMPGGNNWDYSDDRVGNHPADDASEVAQQETATGLEYNLQSILDAVDGALRKMELGTYGVCDNCGQPIAEARLQALPYATLCVNCKVKLEKQR